MTPGSAAHLSGEELDDVLIGLGTPESEAHLAGCEQCRAQVRQFRSNMSAFNQATLAWSQARPATNIGGRIRNRARRSALAPLGWALAGATIVLLAGVPMWNHSHHSTQNVATLLAPQQQDTEAQIAQDNELLRSVNAAINQSDASPYTEYHLAEGPHPLRKNRPEVRNR